MSKSIKINLQELVDANILSEAQAVQINQFYTTKNQPSENRLLAIFGVLGAVLIGLGLILIIAHNWDNFSRATRSFFAFLPLIMGQILAVFAYFKKKNNPIWLESTATFLFFAVGACIAMVSQIYNLQGELSSFLLTWILLTLPLVYVMPSRMVSLLQIVWISWYAGATWGGSGSPIPWLYLPLMVSIFPFFYQLYRKHFQSNAFTFNLWFWATSVTIFMAAFVEEEIFLFLIYAGLFGCYFLLGSQSKFQARRLTANPLLVIGAMGSLILFLITSFGSIMREIQHEEIDWASIFATPELYLWTLLIGLNIWLLFKIGLKKDHPLKYTFIVFALSFLVGRAFGISLVSNLFMLWMGMFYILRGDEKQHLGWLNFGLLIITILIVCRFFDTDLNFVLRGVLFVLLGCGFLFANLRIIQRRKS